MRANKEINKNMNHYEILGITRNASDENIKQSYRKLSMIYHPDKAFYRGENAEGIRQSGKYFRLINNAYETLSDPHKRAIYDASLPADNHNAGTSANKKEASFFPTKATSPPPQDTGSTVTVEFNLENLLYETTLFQMFTASYGRQQVVAIKPKGWNRNVEPLIDELVKVGPSIHYSMVETLAIYKKGHHTYIILESISLALFQIFEKNKQFTASEILEHAINLGSASCALINVNIIPVFSINTIYFTENFTIKLMHPELQQALFKCHTETSDTYGLSKFRRNLELLFRPPESFNFKFRKSESSAVFEFGAFLLYITIGDLNELLNKSVDDIIQISRLANHLKIPAHCSSSMGNLIESCMHVDPGKRPSFAQVLSDIKEIMRNESDHFCEPEKMVQPIEELRRFAVDTEKTPSGDSNAFFQKPALPPRKNIRPVESKDDPASSNQEEKCIIC